MEIACTYFFFHMQHHLQAQLFLTRKISFGNIKPSLLTRSPTEKTTPSSNRCSDKTGAYCLFNSFPVSSRCATWRIYEAIISLLFGFFLCPSVFIPTSLFVILRKTDLEMPTVVLLDVSLSMLRHVQTPEDEFVERRHLAIRGLHTFFDYLSSKFKLEFSALLAFSSLWEIVVPFTRDYQALKQGCITVDVYDKTSFENGFSGVVGHVIEEWGTSVPCQVILVTDGRTGSGQGSLRELLEGKRKENSDQPSPFPIPFPCKIHVVCIATANELGGDLMLFQRLCDSTSVGGSVYVPDMPLTVQSVQNVFTRLAQTHYISYEGTLSCGHLQSKITLSPPPDLTSILEVSKKTKGQEKTRRLPNELAICGFLDVADVGSPPHISRHLVIPLASSSGDSKDKEGSKETAKDSEEDGKTPSFCVLLHGSLKVEKMVAIVTLE